MKFFEYLVTVISYLISPEKRKLISISYSLKKKNGIEIGGPSGFFKLKSPFPVYVFARQIDGVNFSNDTVWEGIIKEGMNYHYSNQKTGYQFIREASELDHIPKNNYDFLLSCHSLEHIANPIKAVKNWNKVLKENAKLILILPDKNFTFDNKRPFTTFEHLLHDYQNQTGEEDSTHFEEVIELHDISKDPVIKSREELKSRTENNLLNRCVHHHVFSLQLLEKLINYCGFRILHQQKLRPFHLVIIAEKITS